MKIEEYSFGFVVVDTQGVALSKAYKTKQEAHVFLTSKKMSASELSILNQAEINLHSLKNTFPCGIRSIDDAREESIKRIETFIANLKGKHV